MEIRCPIDAGGEPGPWRKRLLNTMHTLLTVLHKTTCTRGRPCSVLHPFSSKFNFSIPQEVVQRKSLLSAQ